MSEPSNRIPGGFAKSFRKELHSDVWMMPPIYHRVWYWLRMNAQYEAYLFPTREKFGIWVLPGQRITSLQQIAEGVAWREWGKEKVPNKRTIKAVLGWLEGQEMVTVESNAKGTLISIVNWHLYNDSTVEKVTAESNEQYTRSAHKEEGIERKEVKAKPLSSPEALRLSGVLADMILKNNPGNTTLNNGKREATVARWAVDIRGGIVDVEKARKLADDIYPEKADNEIAKLLFKHKLDLEMQDRKDKSDEKKADRRDAQIGMQLASMERRVNSRGGGRFSSDVEFRQSKAAARKEIDLTLKDMNDTKKSAEKAFREQKEAEQFGMPPDYSEYDQLRAEYNEKRRNYNAVLQDYTNSYGEVYAPGAVRARQGMAPPQQKPNVDALLFDNPPKKNNGNRPPLDSFYR